MNIFIVPSWYPSSRFPATGIFFREQAATYALHYPEDNLGIGHWGPNEPMLLLDKRSILRWSKKLIVGSMMRPSRLAPADNLVEYFQPTFTWTRRFRDGNIRGLIKATRDNIQRFTSEVGMPDVIHAQVGYPAGFVAREIASELGIPYVVTEHMGPFPFPSFDVDGQLDQRLFEPLRDAKKLLAVSRFLQAELARHNLQAEVCNNFINESQFVPGDKASRNFTFLHVGRLAPEKEQLLLLKATARLTFDFRLRVIGAGEMESELKNAASELGLEEKVEFLGLKSKEEVASEMSRAGAFVLTSSYENLPVSIMEALSSGLPVISTRCGGPEEMITPANGILVENGNVVELSAAMQQLYSSHENYDSDEIRREFLKKFGSQVVCEKLRSYYLEVIQG